MSDGDLQEAPNGTQLGGSFMGWNFTVRGAQSIIVIVLLALVVMVLYGASKMATTVTEALDAKGVRDLAEAIAEEKSLHEKLMHDHSISISREHNQLGETIKSLNETMQEQNYIITLNDKERAELKAKLRVPLSLRDKMH